MMIHKVVYSGYLGIKQFVRSVAIPSALGAIVSQILGSKVVHAASSGIVTLPFSVEGPSTPRNPGTRAFFVSRVTGFVQIHPTGHLSLQYDAIVDIYDGNYRLCSSSHPINVLFILYNEHGHILTSFRESYVQAGRHNNVLPLDKETIPKVRTLRVVISY